MSRDRVCFRSGAAWVGGSNLICECPHEPRTALSGDACSLPSASQEFLGLSNKESAYVEPRVRLADRLRQRRQKRNMSQTELARMVHSSQSRVAKMEGAIRPSPLTS